jgi:hypothetical protein
VACRRFEYQLERVQRQLSEREAEMRTEAEVYGESMETLKRWYQEKWVAIQSSRLENHFASKLEKEALRAAEEQRRHATERGRLTAELRASDRGFGHGPSTLRLNFNSKAGASPSSWDGL